MIAHEHIVQFWQEVHDNLVQVHRKTSDLAWKDITSFIALAEKQHFLNAVYHRNIDEIAETIAQGLAGKKRRSSGKANQPKPVSP